MSNLTKVLAILVVVLAIGAGLVVWKTKVGGHGADSFNRVSREEMTILLKDLNPMQLKSISGNPEQKKKIAENIQQLLAVASQARKEGIADDPVIKAELESIRAIVTATFYDKHINKTDGQMPPFSLIKEEQIKQFWGEGQAEPSGFQAAMDKIGLGWVTGEADKRRNESEFRTFLDGKIALAKESGRFPKDRELTEDDIKQAKEDYARIKIYEQEANEKKNELGEEFKRELELQVKMQQAQFLASRYVQKVFPEKAKVTDEDIQKYMEAHPEYNTAEKRAKAEQILSRARAGEDFAQLANAFSEDPGNQDPGTDSLKGGLYDNVPLGRMVPEFEQAALALQPGQVTENLVETAFGYHIIKLERRGASTEPSANGAETYDVRHILIGTTVKDPSNPMGREVPAKEAIKAKLEEEKQKQVLDEIVKNNPVEVPEDFEIPTPSDEELEQMQKMMMQQQMPMGHDEDDGHGHGAPPSKPAGAQPPPASKPAPKK